MSGSLTSNPSESRNNSRQEHNLRQGRLGPQVRELATRQGLGVTLLGHLWFSTVC